MCRFYRLSFPWGGRVHLFTRSSGNHITSRLSDREVTGVWQGINIKKVKTPSSYVAAPGFSFCFSPRRKPRKGCRCRRRHLVCSFRLGPLVLRFFFHGFCTSEIFRNSFVKLRPIFQKMNVQSCYETFVFLSILIYTSSSYTLHFSFLIRSS